MAGTFFFHQYVYDSCWAFLINSRVCWWESCIRFSLLFLSGEVWCMCGSTEGYVCERVLKECWCNTTLDSFSGCLWRCCILSQQWGRQEEDPVRLQQWLCEWRSPPNPTQGLLETEDLPEGRFAHEQAFCIHAAPRFSNTITLAVHARHNMMHNE